MSFNIYARLGDLEALTTTSLSLKADTLNPTFVAPVTIKDERNNTLVNFDYGETVINTNVDFYNPVFFYNTVSGITNSTGGLSNVKNIDAAAYTDQKLKDLALGAPTLLNTITELAAAINNGPTYASDVAANLATLSNNVSHRTQQYYFNSGVSVIDSGPTYVKIGTLSNITNAVQHFITK